MVRVVAAQVVDVHRHQRVVREALEEFVNEVDVERADERAHERHVEFEPRTAGEIEDDARQRFVERHVRVAVAADAALVAERLSHGLAERDADVLDRVVRVDVQIALGRDGEVEHAMATHLVEHVIEKRNAGRKLRVAAAVDHDADLDLGLRGSTRNLRAADWRFHRRIHDGLSFSIARAHR